MVFPDWVCPGEYQTPRLGMCFPGFGKGIQGWIQLYCVNAVKLTPKGFNLLLGWLGGGDSLGADSLKWYTAGVLINPLPTIWYLRNIVQILHMQQSGHTRAGPAPQGQPGCELTVWSSQVVVATVMFAGLSRGVLHPQMTGCEELPLVVAASVLGMQTQCGSTQGLWLATRRLPGHYVPVEYGDCWDQWSVGDKWVSPSWGETALVWWHATGQVLMFLHNGSLGITLLRCALAAVMWGWPAGLLPRAA